MVEFSGAAAILTGLVALAEAGQPLPQLIQSPSTSGSLSGVVVGSADSNYSLKEVLTRGLNAFDEYSKVRYRFAQCLWETLRDLAPIGSWRPRIRFPLI